MATVTFDAKILDGRIEVPEKYRSNFLSGVKVVLLQPGVSTLNQSFEESMNEAARDESFLSRTLACANDFRFVDSEVSGEW